MFCSAAKAQYALKVGQRIVPVKNGDSLSKRELLGRQVYLLFLPDTLAPNAGVNGIVFVSRDIKGRATVYTVRGNNLLFPTSFANPKEDTLIRSLTIHQINAKNNEIRPVHIRLTLVE